MNDPVNYVQLAQQYASYFASVGAVTVTILTLVVALDKTRVRQHLHSFLVAALIVAATACFAGHHLMAETGVLLKPDTPIIDPGTGKHVMPGARLFFLGSINIYLCTLLFFFAITLLPAAYDRDYTDGLARICQWIFFPLCLVCFLWMGHSAYYYGSQYKWWYVYVVVADVIGGLLGNQIGRGYDAKDPPEWPFIAIIIFIIASLSYVPFVLSDRTFPKEFDLIFYCCAVGISIGLVAGLAMRASKWVSETISPAST